MKRSVAVAVLLLCASALFGAADQYVGSLSAHPWGAYGSGLSAPWLLLPFLVGATQRTPRAAVVMGAACTFVALIGYALMTLSPMENAHLNATSVLAFLRGGNYRWFVAGAVTGPLLGRGGWTWRRGRVRWAVVAVGAFCLEPLCHLVLGSPIRVAGRLAGRGAPGRSRCHLRRLGDRPGPYGATSGNRCGAVAVAAGMSKSRR